MYIDRLKRGAGGILSHDEGYFGSQEGFCTLQNWPGDHTGWLSGALYRSVAVYTERSILCVHTSTPCTLCPNMQYRMHTRVRTYMRD